MDMLMIGLSAIPLLLGLLGLALSKAAARGDEQLQNDYDEMQH